MRRLFARFALAVSAFAIIAGPAAAQTRVTLKSATASSSYYVMMVQLGEVLRAETKGQIRSEEHTSELQSLMRISYAVFCLKKKKTKEHIKTKFSYSP